MYIRQQILFSFNLTLYKLNLSILIVYVYTSVHCIYFLEINIIIKNIISEKVNTFFIYILRRILFLYTKTHF